MVLFLFIAGLPQTVTTRWYWCWVTPIYPGTGLNAGGQWMIVAKPPNDGKDLFW